MIRQIQRAPEIPSCLQALVDEDPRPGRFLLTGSQNFSLLHSVSQSRAGRTALLELLPLDLEEIRRFSGASRRPGLSPRLPSSSAIEAKAGQTPSSRYFKSFSTLSRRLADRGDDRWRLSRRLVVYGGDATQSRSAGELVSWRDITETSLARAGAPEGETAHQNS